MKKIIGAIVSLGVVYFVVVSALAFLRMEKFEMPTSYMAPTITAGEHVLADMKAYEENPPERMDLVVFSAPDRFFEIIEKEKEETILCMRVIGLPEETIEIREDGVYVDSRLIKLPEGLTYTSQGFITKIELGNSEYFLVGDNSPIANDSRYWGALEESNILGKIIDI
jgi:signal peptidase I